MESSQERIEELQLEKEGFLDEIKDLDKENKKLKEELEMAQGAVRRLVEKGEKRMTLMKGDREVHEGMGGELGEMIKELTGKRFECCGTCHKIKTIETLWAYPHSEGLKDGKENGWWLFYHCEKCRYDTAWGKIPGRMK